MADSVNILSINGLPIAKITKGEMVALSAAHCPTCKARMVSKTMCEHGHEAKGRGGSTL